MHVAIWDDEVTYTVEGRGEFPFDMLRRDCAWPASTMDACLLSGTERRRVTLTATKARFVAVGRWSSFGWNVVGGDLFPYAQQPDFEGLAA